MTVRFLCECRSSNAVAGIIIILGWQFLESLALAAVDVGRIDVAKVSQLPHVLVSVHSLSRNGHRVA
jgi:hypothetical protein